MRDKKEKILRAVLELFMETGVGSLKVSKIAAKADVGKGTVYEYFASKEDMFIGAVEYGLQMMTEMIQEKVTVASSFEESFNSLVDCIFDIVVKAPFISIAANPVSMPFTGETIAKLKPIIGKAKQSFTELLKSIIDKGVTEGVLSSPPSEEYPQLILVMITNMSVHRVQSGKDNLDELKSFYYDACLKLLS